MIKVDANIAKRQLMPARTSRADKRTYNKHKHLTAINVSVNTVIKDRRKCNILHSSVDTKYLCCHMTVIHDVESL